MMSRVTVVQRKTTSSSWNSNKRTRIRYDRNEVLDDPLAAMQRAALEAAGKVAAEVTMSVGKGLFAFGHGMVSLGAKMMEELLLEATVVQQNKNNLKVGNILMDFSVFRREE